MTESAGDTPDDAEPKDIVPSRDPDSTGRGERLWLLPAGLCRVELVENLSSFTFDRHETVEGTAPLRIDFYEKAAEFRPGAHTQTVLKAW